jgi:hypothetical protein
VQHAHDNNFLFRHRVVNGVIPLKHNAQACRKLLPWCSGKWKT